MATTSDERNHEVSLFLRLVEIDGSYEAIMFLARLGHSDYKPPMPPPKVRRGSDGSFSFSS